MTAQTQGAENEVSAVISQSWHRCSKFMQRETWQAPHQAQGLTFESICRRKTALLTIGQAALEDAWEFLPISYGGHFFCAFHTLSSIAGMPCVGYVWYFGSIIP